MKVKICGNRRAEDVAMALFADALGFVVATPESRRNLAISEARDLIASVPPFIETVAVTASHDEKELLEIASALSPGSLQVQGATDPDRLQRIRGRIGAKLIVGFAVEGEASVPFAAAIARHCDALLLDSRHEGRLGGTGRTHDWRLSRKIRDALFPFPVILAGGLTPGNVREAIAAVKPYAVDVASGVESEGFKSEELVCRFLEESRNA